MSTASGDLRFQNPAGTADLRAFVSRNYIGGSGATSSEIDRITRYHLYWKFYEGNHYRDYNDSMLAFNYVKAFIDKVNIFLLGKDAFTWKVSSIYSDVIQDELESRIEKLIMAHWRKNNKVSTAYEILQMGSVTGDVWVLVGWDFDNKHAVIKCLDSRHCYPLFKDGDQNKLKSFLVRQPLVVNESHHDPNKYMMIVTEYTTEGVSQWYQKTSDIEVEEKAKFEKKTQKDLYQGIIPIIHIKNKPYSKGYYSVSDATDILKLNKVYNEMSQELKGIIDYFATPTTVITGASAKTLKRGLGNIWSGLPSDANVFNLGLDVDLNAMNEFLKNIKTSMHELSDVPENALGKLQSIGNTSAAALAMTYQPLVQQADLKGISYGNGFTEINSMIIRHISKFDADNKRYIQIQESLQTDDNDIMMDELVVEPVWAYGLPQDEMNILQMHNMKLGMQVTSRRRIMQDLGVNNIPEVMQEILDEAEVFNGIGSPDGNNPEGVNQEEEAEETDPTQMGAVKAPRNRAGKLGTP